MTFEVDAFEICQKKQDKSDYNNESDPRIEKYYPPMDEIDELFFLIENGNATKLNEFLLARPAIDLT